MKQSSGWRRPIIYVAHPLSAPTTEGIEENKQSALRWLAWCRKTFPTYTFIAPWISTLDSLHGDDSDELREAGLIDDCAVVSICDALVAFVRVSSGVLRESKSSMAFVDWTRLGPNPPSELSDAVLYELGEDLHYAIVSDVSYENDVVARGPRISSTEMLNDAARALGWRTDFATGGSPVTWGGVLEEISQRKRPS